MPGVEVGIDHADRDGIGEIRVRGPNIMQGYYRDPVLTAQAISPDGWFRTGDLGRIDPDGAIHVVGRLKELIIRSGFNVYPPEVEAALMTCPGVVQAAVAGRKVPGNEEVLAFVTTDGRATPGTIADHLRERLAAYKQPQHVVVVSEMPMTSAGKIRKPALVRQYAPE